MLESAILDSPGPYLDSIDDEMTEKLSMTRSLFVIPLSASKPSALLAQTENLAAFVAKNQDINVVDLARTLGTRRSRLSERGYMLAGQKTLLDDLHAERLMQVVAGRSYSTHPFAFVFTGKCYTPPKLLVLDTVQGHSKNSYADLMSPKVKERNGLRWAKN